MALLIAFIIVIIETITIMNLSDQLELRIEMKSSKTGMAKIYYDVGDGLNENDSKSNKVTDIKHFQNLSFSLPRLPIKHLRIDPLDGAGEFVIRGIYLYDNLNHLIQNVNLQDVEAFNQISRIYIKDKLLIVETDSIAYDPILNLKFEYPISLSSIYPVTRMIKDNFIKTFHHQRKVFCIVFLFSLIAMFFAYNDPKLN